MERDEYIKELKKLYGKAVKVKDFRLAWDLLEAGRRAEGSLASPERVHKEYLQVQ